MNHKQLTHRCRSLIDAINASHGEGDIGSVMLKLDGTGHWEQRIRVSHYDWAPPVIRKFRIRCNKTNLLTVFTLGHQLTERIK